MTFIVAAETLTQSGEKVLVQIGYAHQYQHGTAPAWKMTLTDLPIDREANIVMLAKPKDRADGEGQ
ncbi:hypothetical protein KM031_21455 (plasmid) [Gemmobacter fulvus]|uniref:Uncharacterized protein n=1 Tax=Gemmobacter fulvus TaxID=2840474 RepID=A0A975PAZ2_9RHOB|nr:hypothetical protein [Gemmobacter fulvus]QWK92995.1 hypothetical protein KM031_21455 [Gemmobacter fulvus]